jgi:hypothetical protein
LQIDFNELGFAYPWAGQLPLVRSCVSIKYFMVHLD